jgi:hypothetical protein
MWLKPKGYSVTTDGWGVETRRDTFTCRHCNHVVEVEPRQDPNEFWCFMCMAPICKRCKAVEWNRPPDQPCAHRERQLAAEESVIRGHLERQWWWRELRRLGPS